MEPHLYHRPQPPPPQPPALSPTHLHWVMLDRFVHRTKGDHEVVNRVDEVADGTLSQISSTCTDQSVAVSLRVADPPAVSRLYLHWSEGFRPDMKEVDAPYVIAAHGPSILFQTYVPHLDQHRSCLFPIDYFVYTASCSDKPPSLRRLPPCFRSGQVNPVVDPLFPPYRFQHQRVMFSNEIGLLCHGNEEFTVAALSSLGELCLLHHTPGEEAMEWDFKNLQLPREEGIPDLLCGAWNTDAVIPLGGSYLCWVDCYLGMLFVGVHGKFTELPPIYHAMPAGLHRRRIYIDRGCPDPARRVCVTDDGVIKLICVGDGAGRGLEDRDCPAFTITTWSLTETGWEKDASMEADEFRAALNSDKRLPQLRPEFPTMSLVNPDVICFMLNDDFHIFWLIEVDVKKKVLGTVTLYINESEEEEGRFDDMALMTVFYGNSFVPSQFTRYLDKHAIKSLGLSKKLQEAKLERAIKNGWIEDPIQGLARQMKETC